MNITLTELTAEIKRLEDKIGCQDRELQQNSLAKYIQELNGKEILTTKEFDFDNNFISLENNQEKLIEYKSLLAEKQAEIQINGKSMVHMMNTVKSNKEILETVKACMEQNYSLERCEADSEHSTVYYKIGKENYDKATLLEIQEVLEQDIIQMEAELQRTNIMAVVNI